MFWGVSPVQPLSGLVTGLTRGLSSAAVLDSVGGALFFFYWLQCSAA